MTTTPRLFVSSDLAEGLEVESTAAQAHYLGAVMRRHQGDAVRLFNGKNGEFASTIAALSRNKASLITGPRLRAQAPESDIWLVFGLLKRDATDLVIQKATELGAAVLLPVTSERTNVARVNEARLLAIATEAAEQCERLTVPTVRPPRPLREILAEWPSERPLYAALERASVPMLRRATGPSALLVGPEGGFSPAELDVLRGHPFVIPVSLGPRILRAETACLAGLALLQAPGCG